jgi:hypothetical protein
MAFKICFQFQLAPLHVGEDSERLVFLYSTVSQVALYRTLLSLSSLSGGLTVLNFYTHEELRLSPQAGSGGYHSPRHRMPFQSREDGSIWFG